MDEKQTGFHENTEKKPFQFGRAKIVWRKVK